MSIFILFFGLFILCSVVIQSIHYKISPMPSSRMILKELSSFLDENPHYQKIVDLGAGFGFSTVRLARKFPTRKILAIEAQFVPFCVIWILKKTLNLRNIQLHKKNFFSLPSIDADCVFCYLYSDRKDCIASFLQKALKPKTAVVSSTFALNLPLKNQIKMSGLFQTSLYFYEI